MDISKITGHARSLGLALALPATVMLGVTGVSAQEWEDTEEPTQEQEHAQEQEVQEGQDLITLAGDVQEISLFMKALKQTGLDQAIQMEGPYTVLAPTNEALEGHFSDDELARFGLKVKDEEERDFERAADYDDERPADAAQQEREEREGMAQQLSAEDREELVRFVRAHIVIGEFASDRLQTGQELQNVLGQTLEVEVDEDFRHAEAETPDWDQERAEREDEDPQAEHAGMPLQETGIQIEDGDVVRADVRAANGVLHVIDSVIEPADPEDIREEQEERQDWDDRDDFEDDDPFDRDTDDPYDPDDPIDPAVH